ncbi:MNIO family bufferin maturase [Kaarinaea lacus]
MAPPLKDAVNPKPVPARSGIGLRAQHYQEILETLPDIGWLEVHSENYFGNGGRPLYYLQKISEHYPLSFHGVGMSIGSTDKIDLDHLDKLKKLIHQFQPHFVSEHLSWGSFQGQYFNDLFPMPYTHEALEHMVNQISFVQEYLGRQILIENVSSYLQFECSTIPEWEFLTELAEQSGCGILLDVNNVYVNASNHQFSAEQFIEAIPKNLVNEIHLAGHTVKEYENNQILIDTHNQLITEKVWGLYKKAIHRFNKTPTLIEWDTDLPKLEVLLSEANKAEHILESIDYSENYEHIA